MDEAKVMELARAAGFDVQDGMALVEAYDCLPQLSAFARLVAAAEREACAAICDEADKEDMSGSNEAAGCAAVIRSRTE